MAEPEASAPSHHGRLADQPVWLHWVLAIGLGAAFGGLLEIVHVPAGLLLGPMLAGVVVALNGGRLSVNRWASRLAQATAGLFIASGITSESLVSIVHEWHWIVLTLLAVVGLSTGLGYALAKAQVLPGGAAIWGSFPGNASTMSLLAQEFGEDIRLVAFMQYLRVILVVIASALVALATSGTAGVGATDWTAPIDGSAFLVTLAFAVAAVLVGYVSRIPAASFLVPLVAGIVVQDLGGVVLEVPVWWLAVAYAIIGFLAGGRFERATVDIVRGALWRVTGSILLLMAACGVLAFGLAAVADVSLLTAYLAVSPGGADSVAIIAAATDVDAPFVLAFQTGRMVVLALLVPIIAKWLVRRYQRLHAHAE